MKKAKNPVRLGAPRWADTTNLDVEERGKACYEDFWKLEADYKSIEQERIDWYAAYDGVHMAPWSSAGRYDTLYSRLQAAQWQPDNVNSNYIKVCVNTLLSQITDSKTRIKFQTTGGGGRDQVKALMLSAYMDGIFYDQEVYEAGFQAFKDCLTDVFGCLKLGIDADKGKITVEWASSKQLYIPNIDIHSKAPREIFQVHEMTLSDIYEEYPDEVIAHLGLGADDNLDSIEDEVFTVVERWRAQSLTFAGRHSIVWKHGELFSEVWSLDFVPFVFCFWSKNPVGFHSTTLVQELAPLQRSINILQRCYYASLKQNAVSRWFVGDSQVEEDELSDATNSIVHGKTMPQQIVTNAVLTADVMNERERVKQDMYETSGVSKYSAAGIKPSGLNSGEAQREYKETANQRFSYIEELFSNMFLRLSKMAIALTKELAASKQEHLVKVLSSNLVIGRVDWKQVDLDEDLYVMKAHKSSWLPTTPAARVELGNELIKLGMDRGEVWQMMEMPDTDTMISMQVASTRAVQCIVDDMCESETMDQDIDPMLDQEAAAKYIKWRFANEMSKGKQRNETQLDLLRRLLDTVQPAPLPMPPAPPQLPALPAPGMSPQLPPPGLPGLPGVQGAA